MKGDVPMAFIGKKIFKKRKKKDDLTSSKKELEKKSDELQGNTFYEQQLQNVTGVGSWKYDVIKNEFYGSQEMHRIYDINPSDFGRDFNSAIQLIHPEDQTKVRNAMDKHLAGESCKLEYRISQKDGLEKYVEVKGEPVFDREGQVIEILGTIQDITEKKALQRLIEYEHQQINKIQRKFQVLIQESDDVFEIIEPDGTLKYANGSLDRITDHKMEDLIGKKIYKFYDKAEGQKLAKMVETVLKNPNKKVQGDVIFRTKAGKDIYLAVHIQNLLQEPAIEGIVLNFRDITDRVEMEKRMAHISTHDQLTDLPNGVYLNRKLRMLFKHAQKTNTRFALMMLDIDGLKYINYSLGYGAGNKLILKIAERLRDFLGNDSLICRNSEDHFAIIIEQSTTNESYEKIAEGMIDLFSHSFQVDTYEIDVSVNIGICIYPEDVQDQDMESFRRKAKGALLRAKKEGENTYKFYSSDLDLQNYKELVLRNDLHHAIEKGQLKVYYQPMVQLKSNEILAAEALIRWEHPDWGLVSPDEFVYLAEETGLIIRIGKWILKEVCSNYKQWLDKGLPAIKISINVSSIQFFENNFVENIKNTIEEFKLDPHFLIIEITESIFVKRVDKVIADIQKLQSFGIQIALDDFGTGFSSLAYLNSFHIDILKIDGSFIKNLPFNHTSTAIVKSVTILARELKIKLVAEGIENWDQLSYLKETNCHTGQGFLYQKPLPSYKFEKILSRKKCKPILVNNAEERPTREKRKFFRIQFRQLLEADATIVEINGKRVDAGNTKILIKDMGPGGIRFVSNFKFPIERDLILQFITQLMDQEIKVYGYPVWREEFDDNLYAYGLEFTLDETERVDLIKILNEVQIKMRKNILFAEGSFTSDSPDIYFKL